MELRMLKLDIVKKRTYGERKYKESEESERRKERKNGKGKETL